MGLREIIKRARRPSRQPLTAAMLDEAMTRSMSMGHPPDRLEPRDAMGLLLDEIRRQLKPGERRDLSATRGGFTLSGVFSLTDDGGMSGWQVQLTKDSLPSTWQDPREGARLLGCEPWRMVR